MVGMFQYVLKHITFQNLKYIGLIKYSQLPKPNMTVHSSTYLETPIEWLGREPTLDEAEILKEINPKAYEHEYLGMAAGDNRF